MRKRFCSSCSKTVGSWTSTSSRSCQDTSHISSDSSVSSVSSVSPSLLIKRARSEQQRRKCEQNQELTFEKRFKIRPEGVESKNVIGARMILAKTLRRKHCVSTSKAIQDSERDLSMQLRRGGKDTVVVEDGSESLRNHQPDSNEPIDKTVELHSRVIGNCSAVILDIVPIAYETKSGRWRTETDPREGTSRCPLSALLWRV